MKREKLPNVLMEWLTDRDFYVFPCDADEPGYLTEDEIYSAAIELRSDMEPDDFGESLYTSQERAIITRFINREKATHEYVSLDKWYL